MVRKNEKKRKGKGMLMLVTLTCNVCSPPPTHGRVAVWTNETHVC